MADLRAARRRERARIRRGLTAAAVVGLVGVVTAVGSGTAVSGPTPVPADVVRVPASARTLVCPGPLALPDDAVAGDAAFDPTPAPTSITQRVVTVAPPGTAVAGPASLTPLGEEAPLVALSGEAPVLAGAVAGVGSATVLRAQPSSGNPATVAGASASVTPAGDLRGLAAASCQAPAASLWLVGGSTEIGSSALLVVANPGRTAAEVTVEVLGPAGVVETPGATFLVAPGAERALLLEGVAAEQRRLAVHVTAAGGQVTAYLQTTRLDGFTPAGTDLVTAGVTPGTRQVVGGLVVPATDVAATDTAQVRVVAPGEEPATVRLTLLGPDGPVRLPGAERLVVDAGEVTDVSLAGLPPGAYTAVVDADVPVVAGAVLTRQGPPVELGDIPTVERAWAASARAGSGGIVALPDGVAATVVLGAVADPGEPVEVGTAAGTVRVLGADGTVLSEIPVSVPAGSTVRLDATGVAALSGGAPVGAVQLVPEPATAEDAPELAWWVLASVGPPTEELVSVLRPVPDPPSQPSVALRSADRLGLVR